MRYQCEVCGTAYNDIGRAESCEQGHKAIVAAENALKHKPKEEKK